MNQAKILSFLIWCCTLFAVCYGEMIAPGFQGEISVDLREPIYSDGILTTDQGGVITGPKIRIQALQMRYTKKVVDEVLVFTIEAEEQLIIEFGEYTFVGQKLYYDFQKKEGVIYEARTSSEPWFLAGERFELRPDGSYIIYNGYVTTSEQEQPDWGIYSDTVTVDSDLLSAEHVRLRFFDYTVLWVPSLKANLNSIFDSPIRYRFRWGGRQGPRLGITYEIFSWERWKTFLRFDYRLTRGPGLGFETRYRSDDKKTIFRSINYIARDSSLIDPHEKIRFRYEGFFKKQMDHDKLTCLFTYDKISDLDMPSNYYDRDFDIDKSERSQLLIRRQEENWIGNFYTRVRVNHFQTVKQELPSFYLNLKPVEIGKTGIIVDNRANVSYLDFKYSTDVDHVHNFASSRMEYTPLIYRPFKTGPFTCTPEIGGVAIFYGTGPKRHSQTLTLGIVGCELQTQLYRSFCNYKHVIEPYTSLHCYTSPSSSPHHHYIFDISDGWTKLNQLTFGFSNSLYGKREEAISKIFYADVYAHAFINSGHIHPTIPKIYTTCALTFDQDVKYTMDTAWDCENHQLDHFNFRSEWTLSQDFAISAEFRHRSAYSWRKVDFDNFFMETFHSDRRLRHSHLSDRRDTLLCHFFYRFLPNWALECVTRQGWDRITEPRYLEYEIDLITTIQTAWHLRISFQHQENDTRMALYFNMGLNR